MDYPVFSGKEAFFSNGFKGVVSTISPHSCIVACEDSLFSEALMASDFIIPDGVGIIMAASVIEGEPAEKNMKRY